MRVRDIPEINELSIPEKILLVEELWDNLTIDEASIPIPESHMEELEKRLRNYKSDPGNLLSFEELQARINNRK